MKDKKNRFYNKDEAYFILNRIDGWIHNCDTKFSILLALLGIFFGLTINIFKCFKNLHMLINCWNDYSNLVKATVIISNLFVIIYVVLIVLCTIFSFLGINAKIKNKNDNILFWGNLSKYKDIKEVNKNFSKLTEDEYLKLLNEQILTNSIICTKKYINYKKALLCLFVAILFAILSIIMINI